LNQAEQVNVYAQPTRTLVNCFDLHAVLRLAPHHIHHFNSFFVPWLLKTQSINEHTKHYPETLPAIVRRVVLHIFKDLSTVILWHLGILPSCKQR